LILSPKVFLCLWMSFYLAFTINQDLNLPEAPS
jgi:hypothetical protein